MHIQCPLESITKAVAAAERLVGKKESLPVLSCILIEAKKHECVLTATNLEAGVEISFPCKGEKEGKVAVPATLLSHVIKNARGEQVVMELIEGSLLVKTKGGSAHLKTVPHDEFPSIPKTAGSLVEVDKKVLIDGITSVSYAAAQSNIRPEFASVYIHQEGQKLFFTATDSFRLAERVFPLDGSIEVPETLLPTKNSLELVHLLESIKENTVSLSIEDGQISVQGEGVRFVSRVVDATFPNYQAIIPKTFTAEAITLKADVLTVLRKARFFAHTTQQISVHIYPSKKSLTVTASHQETGNLADTIESTLKGDDIDINFNIGYVADGVAVVPDDSIQFLFAGPGKPLVVRGIHDHSFTYLVMPLNR